MTHRIKLRQARDGVIRRIIVISVCVRASRIVSTALFIRLVVLGKTIVFIFISSSAPCALFSVNSEVFK